MPFTRGSTRRPPPLGQLLLGNLLLSLGIAVFILPYNLNIGGVSGLALVLHAHLRFPSLQADQWILLLSWLLFLLGWCRLGKDFALRTLLSTVAYPLTLSLLLQLTQHSPLRQWLALDTGLLASQGLLIAALFGGTLVGAGCALCYLGGGSTGGMDILALLLSKRIRGVKKGHAVFFLDAAIILLEHLFSRDLGRTLTGVLAAFVAAFVLERVLWGSNGALLVEIVSKKDVQIGHAVIEHLHRTTTRFPATGGYSKESCTVLRACVRVTEYAALLALIRRIDPGAFVTAWPVKGVNGNGWEQEPVSPSDANGP